MHMKNHFVNFATACMALFLLSCGQGDDPQVESIKNIADSTRLKEAQVRSDVDSTVLENTASENVADMPVQESSEPAPGTKRMTMNFDDYGEGDYPHLFFTDLSTGERYDFRFLNDNNLNGLPIIVEDESGSFGYKANPKYLNKQFIVEARKKLVLDSDLEGNVIKSKEWVISSIKLK